MGLLRDTYIINKVDTSKISYEMKRKNDIEKEQNIILNNTRDRVDISLKEYEDLKNSLKIANEMLRIYQNYYENLGKKIQVNPEELLKYKLVKSETERKPMTMSNYLYLVFEIKNKELL